MQACQQYYPRLSGSEWCVAKKCICRMMASVQRNR